MPKSSDAAIQKAADPRYIFIDESGDLGKHGQQYFIIAAVATKNPKEIRRIMKRFRERRLKKSLRQVPEIKANKSTPEIRKHMLSELYKCDCQIFALAVDKGKLLSRFDQAQDRLYHYLCGMLLAKVPIKDDMTIIIIDQKDTNKLIKKNFKNYIEMIFKRKGRKIQFSQIESFNDNGLLIVDFVAWSINRKLNFNDSSYYEIIRGKVTNDSTMEIWKDDEKVMDPSSQSDSEA